MNSERLPGKSMALIEDVPLIEHIVRRVQAAQYVQKVCVCTTDNALDDPLAAHVESLGVDVYRGSEDDVLSRFYWATQAYPDALVIVRITADDPFTDPELIDYAINGFLGEWANRDDATGQCHYLTLGGEPTTAHPTRGITWPLGLNVEVFSRSALDLAHQSASSKWDREHVTPWMAEAFRLWDLKNPCDHGSINTRWTIDTEDDLAFTREVYARLYADDHAFGYAALREAGY